MIVIYNTSSLVITQIAGGTDSSVYSYMAARVGAGEDIFSVTDDIAVMNSPAAYVVVPPTGTERTKSISVIPSVNPIELNATPTLTIQLLDKNLNPDAVSGITVILRATNGIVTPPSFVTNAGGNNTETITYHPNKTFGTIDIVAEESPTGLYYPGFLTMTINGPDTAAEQNWLTTDDVKDASIDNDKLSVGLRVTTPPPPSQWIIDTTYQRNDFDIGLTDSINSIVVDDGGYMYVNGVNSGTPTLVKANRITGEVIDSLTYTAGEAVTGVGYERMAYDGKWLWLPAQQNVIKVDPVTMAVSGTVALGGTASHRSQSLIWDGHSIYAILSHTSLGTGGIYKINPTTEAVTTILSGSGAAKTVDTSMDRITLYTLDNDGNGIAYPNKTTPGAGWASATGLQQALVVDPYSIWTGGSDGVERVGISSANYNASSDQTVVGDVVSMIWTGEDNAVWAITTTDETVENASKLRKLVQSGGSIIVAEEFDLGTTFYPIWMTADTDNIYVGAWGTGRVAKFAMRKI